MCICIYIYIYTCNPFLSLSIYIYIVYNRGRDVRQEANTQTKTIQTTTNRYKPEKPRNVVYLNATETSTHLRQCKPRGRDVRQEARRGPGQQHERLTNNDLTNENKQKTTTIQ